MNVGSEFQRVGAAIAKARSPKVRRLVRTIGVRRLVPAERRWRVGWLVLFQELREVGRGQVMEGLVGEEEELILNAIMNR